MIQCFVRYVQANTLVNAIRNSNREHFEGASTIQRSYRCYKARILYGLKRRIKRVENAVLYAKKKQRKYVYNLKHEIGHNLGRLPHYSDPVGGRFGIDLNIMDYGPIKEGYTSWQLEQMVLTVIQYRDYLIL